MTVLDWHYGPTATDPNPGAMWHVGCGGEVWYLKTDPSEQVDGRLVDHGGYVCSKCGADDDDRP